MPNELVEFWRHYDIRKPPFVHPCDLPILASQRNPIVPSENTFEKFLKSKLFGEERDRSFHFSMTPIPYGGNLAKAKIFILLLNPGLSYADYYGMQDKAFRTRLEKNLRQDFSDVEFPFLWLDPAFCWHPGFVWWESKLRKTIRKIADRNFKGNYLRSLKYLSKRIAHIEMVPYHSKSFANGKLIEELPSSLAAQNFVQQVLLPKAERGTANVIVTRKGKEWGISRNSKGVTLYKGGATRSASLGPTSQGGKVILRKTKPVSL